MIKFIINIPNKIHIYPFEQYRINDKGKKGSLNYPKKKLGKTSVHSLFLQSKIHSILASSKHDANVHTIPSSVY